jgi:uncharacterized protein YlxW (UPF0749 family)
MTSLLERLRPNPKSPKIRHALTIGFVTLSFGLLLSVTLRGADSDELFENSNESDLIVLLDSLQQRLSRLQAEQFELRSARSDILAGDSKEALAKAQEQLFAMNVLNGSVPVQGSGLEVRVQTEENFSYDLMLSLVQELRDAGAEAIEVNGLRINARSYFGQTLNGIVTLNGERIFPVYLLKVIGDAETIETALTIPGGVVDSIASEGGSVYISPIEIVQILSIAQVNN